MKTLSLMGVLLGSACSNNLAGPTCALMSCGDNSARRYDFCAMAGNMSRYVFDSISCMCVDGACTSCLDQLSSYCNPGEEDAAVGADLTSVDDASDI